MNYPSLAKQGMRNALAAALYVVLVALLMSNVQSLFGTDVPEVFAAIFMILLFMVSALITGSLVLWGPVRLLVDGHKAEAGVLLGITGTSLVCILGILGLVLVLLL